MRIGMIALVCLFVSGSLWLFMFQGDVTTNGQLEPIAMAEVIFKPEVEESTLPEPIIGDDAVDLSDDSASRLAEFTESRLLQSETYLDHENYPHAVGEIDGLIKADPNNAYAYYLKAYGLAGMDEYEEAIVEMEVCIRLVEDEGFRLHAMEVCQQWKRLIGQAQ